MVIMGWLLSLILSFLVSKFFVHLSFDRSRKLRKLEIDTIPSLKETLRKVEEQRMLGVLGLISFISAQWSRWTP